MENLNRDIFCERARELFGDTSQMTLAKETGISQGVISVISRGESKAVTADIVYRLAKHFNVSSDWLMGLSNVKTPERATNELCDTLGLSEKVVSFLRGESSTAYEKNLRMLGKNEDADLLRKNEIEELRHAINEIAGNHIDYLNTENPTSLSLVYRIEKFWDTLKTEELSMLNLGGSLKIANAEKEEIVRFNPSADVWLLDVKKALIAAAIQDINEFFIEQKNEIIKKFGA